MSGGKQVGPVRDLVRVPLDDKEVARLAAGENPRYIVTIDTCDAEELIGHLARRLQSLLAIANEAAADADNVAYHEFNDDSEEHQTKIAEWKAGK